MPLPRARFRLPLLVLAALLLPWLALRAASGPAAAQAAGQAPLACAAGQTDDTMRPLPPGLVPAARRAFGLSASMPASVIAETTVYRCDAGRTLICTAGANLPCGKADRLTTSAAADSWCAAEKDGAVVPAFVTGHDTAYAWACQGGKAVAGRPAPLDDRGFFRDYWKPVS